MTQTVTLPNGDTIDFPDNMSQDDLSAAVSRHIAATVSNAALPAANEPSIAARGAGFPTPEPGFYDRYVAPYIPPLHAPLDAQGQPVATPISQGTQLIGDVALHANPFLALSNAAFVAAQHGFNALSSKLGGPTKDVWSPLDSVANIGDLTVDPNAGTAMKTAHEVGPWLVPTGNQLGRVGEAAGPFNKAMTFLRSEGGNVVDWAASDAFQKMAADQGWGPLAQMIAGAAGGNVRQGVNRTVVVPTTRAVVGAKPEGGDRVDTSKALLPEKPEDSPVVQTIKSTLGIKPTDVNAPPPTSRGFGIVPPFRDVADPNSSGANLVSGAGAIPLSGTGETGAVKAQTAAIARTADAGLQGLDPSVTPVQKAGPASLKATGSDLAQEARGKILPEERRLMASSDAIDNAVGDTRTDPTSLWYAAQQLAEGKDAQGKDVGPTVQDQAAKIRDNIERMVGPDGKVAYSALKTERAAFRKFIDDQYVTGGDAGAANMLARNLQPIKEAMSQTMGAAADEAGAATGNPDLGAQFRQNDADWSTHSAIKHQLVDIGGQLNEDRTGFKPAPGGQNAASILSKGLEGGKKGIAPLIDIEQGLGERQARKGVAETVAAMGTPKKAESDYAFQPSTFGKGVKNIDQEAMNYIEAKAGPEARMNLENAAEAGVGTSQPPKQSGMRRGIANVLSALPYVGPAAVALHPAAVLSPLVSMITSMTNDPDFIRTVANRNVPMTSGDLAKQMVLHAALGSRPNPVSPTDALLRGAGQAAGAVKSVLPRWMGGP